MTFFPLRRMQAPDMRAFRSLYLCKTLKTLSAHNSNPIITYYTTPNLPRFPKKFHSTPYRRFPPSTAADETTAFGWSVFPNSQPPVDSPSRQTPTVEAVYDPISGHIVTNRHYNGSKEVDPGVEKAETAPPVEVGSRVYGDVIGSSSVRSSIKKKGKSRSVHVCESCGYSDGQWWGTCKQCGEVGTMKRFTTESADRRVSGVQVSENAVRSWLPKDAAPVRLTDVYDRVDDLNWRIPL